ncbi:MAG: cation transporter [Dehalococcoidales bacterium]|nr:MAG: cation transporter [Dehalococcoidales bacterium]
MKQQTGTSGNTRGRYNKQNIAKISIIAIGSLIIIKIIASFITGSVGIRADAIHSIIDLSGAMVGFIAIRFAQKPSDEDHAYGHGKAENIAGMVIAAIIFLAGGMIIYEAVTRLITGAEIEMVTVGIVVTSVAIVINLAVSRYVMRIARLTDSVALEATARDMLADVFSSVAVLLGLILVGITGVALLDTIVALIVALLIIRAAFITMKKSLGGLIDASLPAEEQGIIHDCISEYSASLVEVHNLRTRKSGAERFIDFHLVVPRTMQIEEAHSLCDHIQEKIENSLPMTNVTIHTEPCVEECEECALICDIRFTTGTTG